VPRIKSSSSVKFDNDKVHRLDDLNADGVAEEDIYPGLVDLLNKIFYRLFSQPPLNCIKEEKGTKESGVKPL